MAGFTCDCGNSLSNSTCPSTDILCVYGYSEIKKCLSNNPKSLVYDCETMERPYQYWYCPSCKKVYVIDMENHLTQGIYYPIDIKEVEIPDGLEEIRVFTDVEIYNAIEDNIELRTILEQKEKEMRFYLDSLNSEIWISDLVKMKITKYKRRSMG